MKLGAVIGSVSAIVLLLFGSYFFISQQGDTIRYSSNPKDWILDEEDSKIVSIDRVSFGASFVDERGQQFQGENVQTVFSLAGVYNGEEFNAEYFDKQLQPKMRITQEFNPNDGVIEGYMIEIEEKDQMVVYIFVDEDWKKQLPRSEIFWGATYQNQKQLSFEEIEEGVYMDKIVDDPNRFAEGISIHYGGIVVGQASAENIESMTVMKLT